MNRDMTPRLAYLDTARAVLVVLVVALHAWCAYAPATSWWYVDDKTKFPPADLIVALLDGFLMPPLFFLAGFFTLPSLARRGPLDFCLDKFRRLCLPAMGLMLGLVPIMTYVRVRAETPGQALGFGEYWTGWMAGAADFGLVVIDSPEAAPAYMRTMSPQYLWFVLALFAFFLVAALVAAALTRFGPCASRLTTGGSAARNETLKRTARALGSGAAARNEEDARDGAAGVAGMNGGDARDEAAGADRPAGRTARGGWGAIMAVLAACLAMVLAATLAGLAYREGTWIKWGPLVLFQPTRLPFYIGFFCLGLLAFRNGLFTSRPWPGPVAAWGAGFALLCLALLVTTGPAYAPTPPSPSALGVYFAVRAGMALAALGLLAAAGQRWWNRPGRLAGGLAKSSYDLYLLHQPVVVLLQLALVGLAWPASGKFPLVFGGALILCLGAIRAAGGRRWRLVLASTLAAVLYALGT